MTGEPLNQSTQSARRGSNSPSGLRGWSASSARRFSRVLLVTLALSLAPPLAAQTTAMRIGYVDMKRLLDNAPQVVAGRQKLEREFAPRDTALSADEMRLVEMRSRYERDNASMNRTEAEALRREIDAFDRSIRRNRDNLRSELKTRSDQELDRSWREINNAVVEFAREQGIDLIVPSPVIYASQRIDVTDQVLERLKRKHTGKASSP
ncbi:OmpH family outer membrane protein [Dokdonella sp.]|uniref:OmpH family outer membrane protein n=1 Tax=Dokdonella sp. TaxID=2291710 RepID=UPI003C64EFBB